MRKKTSTQPFIKTTSKPHPIRDSYYWLITHQWSVFLTVLATGFISMNLIFASIYYFTQGIFGVPNHSFLQYFFFSIHTLATVGYGNMYPVTPLAEFCVSIEIMLGIFMIAVTTGLMFAKFSLPTAKVVYSKVAVIQTRNEKPTLTFRLANERGNHIAEASIHVAILKNETTKEGDKLRKLHDLKLERYQTPMFILSWSIFHVIDEHSPLFGLTQKDIEDDNITITVSFSGLEPVLGQTVHSRYLYYPKDLVWNARLVDSLSRLDDGTLHLDYDKFHTWESTDLKV